MRFKLGELFCGPGGIAVGATNSQILCGDDLYEITHEWANDYDPNTCLTYIKNICPDNPETVICKDVRVLEIESLPPIDALAFGFPCNDFSAVGEQLGFNGKFGPLYTYGVRTLNAFKPKWFVAENVGGLKNANDGVAFKTILNALSEAGYNIFPHLYKFEEYGVPQARHRIVIVGIRNDINLEFRIPKPTHTPENYITCFDAIMNPPIILGSVNHDFTKQSKNVIDRLKYIKPGQNAFNADIPEHLKLKVKGAKISQIYRRLDPKRPAYTVTGSGGGGTHIYHWEQNRSLTNRERARLQTFPDNFIFEGNKESVRKQIGMAVPPVGAQIIFESILKTFAGVDYEHVNPNIKYDNGQFI